MDSDLRIIPDVSRASCVCWRTEPKALLLPYSLLTSHHSNT